MRCNAILTPSLPGKCVLLLSKCLHQKPSEVSMSVESGNQETPTAMERNPNLITEVTTLRKMEKYLPSLSPGELETLEKELGSLREKCESMITCSKYFNLEDIEHRKAELPSNAIALVKDETINIVEVLRDLSSNEFDEEGSATIKATVKGIEEVVELYMCRRWRTCIYKIKIGEQKYCLGFPLGTDDTESSTDEVVEILRRALGIPTHQTTEMIVFLFLPYKVTKQDIEILKNYSSK